MSTKTADECLSEIWQLSIDDRTKPIKLINKIFSNLINNPNDDNFKDINFEKVQQKLSTSQSFIDLLLIAGFVIHPNQKRLYFDDQKRNNLLDTHKLLQHKLSNNLIPSSPTDTNTNNSNKRKQPQPQQQSNGHQNDNDNDNEHESKYEQKHDDENEEEEEKKYSNDNDQENIAINSQINTLKQLQKSDNKDTVLSYLMNMGYDREEVLDALSAANNDVEMALDILLNNTIEQHKFIGTSPNTKMHLKDLMQIPEQPRLIGMKGFYDICSKLLDNLDNKKYYNLNYDVICKKFQDCPPCIQLLQDAGFIKSKDGTRLIFNKIYMKHISNVMQQMNDMLD